MLWAEAEHVRSRLGSFAGSNIMKTCVYLGDSCWHQKTLLGWLEI